jgi:hypothetical protein
MLCTNKQGTGMQIAAASWFTRLPSTHVRVGISRGTPRGQAAGYKQYRVLCPEPWFNSVRPDEYLRRYNEEILGKLLPSTVATELTRFGEGRVPTLLCYESASDIQCGAKWCHRHIVAQWLEDHLGIEVPEVDHPNLDRFRFLREHSYEPPNYRTASDLTASVTMAPCCYSSEASARFRTR